MSKETSDWLNRNVLIGMTDKRGNAWHYKASAQGDEPNHYAGAIPVEDVRRRLFNWQALEVPMMINTPTGPAEVPNRKAIVRSDNYAVLGVPSSRYVPHQYDEWLLTNVAHLLDDDLVIGSAGLLAGGGEAWVQVEMPENHRVADVEFRPNLLATTSFNLSLATTFKRTITVVVCDNTRAAALRENSQQVSVRHTAGSIMRLNEARSALDIVMDISDDFTREVEMLLEKAISDAAFGRIVDSMVPVPDDASKHKATRSSNLKDSLWNLWRTDHRCAPWKNTGFGVMQVFNTHRQFDRPTRGGTLQVERTMHEHLTGVTEVVDRKVAQLVLAAV